LPRVLSGTAPLGLAGSGKASIQAPGLLQLKLPDAAVTCRSGLFCATQSRNRASGVQALTSPYSLGLLTGLTPPDSSPICTSPAAVWMKPGPPLSWLAVAPSNVEVGIVRLKKLSCGTSGF